MQFSTKIDGFEQKDSQGFENSYNSYEQYPLEKFFIFTIYQNYTLALIMRFIIGIHIKYSYMFLVIDVECMHWLLLCVFCTAIKLLYLRDMYIFISV